MIEQLINEELERANTKYQPKFNSIREGYIVLREEIEEAKEDVDFCFGRSEQLWHYVRNKELEHMGECADRIEKTAIAGIKELIQVAAMCRKFRMSLAVDLNNKKGEIV